MPSLWQEDSGYSGFLLLTRVRPGRFGPMQFIPKRGDFLQFVEHGFANHECRTQVAFGGFNMWPSVGRDSGVAFGLAAVS